MGINWGESSHDHFKNIQVSAWKKWGKSQNIIVRLAGLWNEIEPLAMKKVGLFYNVLLAV